MARNDSMWQKVKKTISNEIRDDEKLAGNLSGQGFYEIIRGIFTIELPLRDRTAERRLNNLLKIQDFWHGFNTALKENFSEGHCDPSLSLEELRISFEMFREQLPEGIAEKRLLRAVALFAGSVFVMRNFGELMAV